MLLALSESDTESEPGGAGSDPSEPLPLLPKQLIVPLSARMPQIGTPPKRSVLRSMEEKAMSVGYCSDATLANPELGVHTH